MKKKIVLGLMLVGMFLSVGLIGCVGNSTESSMNTEDSGNTQYQTDSFTNESSSLIVENTEQDNSESGTLDFAQAANNIVLNGENIKLPTTLGELGEDYSLGEKKDTANELGYVIDWYELVYKSEVIGAVWLLNDAEKMTEDLTICGIDIEKSDFSVDGISIGQNVDIAFKQWGEPTDKIELRTRGNIYKYRKDIDSLDIHTEKENKNKIEALSLSYMDFLDKKTKTEDGSLS